ncbi:MAG: hypothetical protein H7Y38_12790, partial [Armatimonadetes bacterium]|nr:hypothetical protein [Armatimonadota bacterium]
AEIIAVKTGRISGNDERPGVSGRTNPELIKAMSGHLADSTNFDAVMQSIESERERRDAGSAS